MEGKPTPLFLPGKPHGQRSLAGYSPWGHKESDTIEHVHARTSVQKWIGGILVDMETAVRATRVVLIRDDGALGQGALSTRTFVGKVMSLLFNMLSRLVIAFLPRSKCLLISWQQSPSTVILDPKKIKSLTLSIVSPSICHEVMGPDAIILAF